jgi:hypothetical protein
LKTAIPLPFNVRRGGNAAHSLYHAQKRTSWSRILVTQAGVLELALIKQSTHPGTLERPQVLCHRQELLAFFNLFYNNRLGRLSRPGGTQEKGPLPY